jgi:hypothetical protein
MLFICNHVPTGTSLQFKYVCHLNKLFGLKHCLILCKSFVLFIVKLHKAEILNYS